MAFLPDYINPQPDDGMVASIRHLSEHALSTCGHVLSAEHVDALTGILVTGTMQLTAMEASALSEAVNNRVDIPGWVTDLFYALHQLSPLTSEAVGNWSDTRQQWNLLARKSLKAAESELSSLVRKP